MPPWRALKCSGMAEMVCSNEMYRLPRVNGACAVPVPAAVKRGEAAQLKTSA